MLKVGSILLKKIQSSHLKDPHFESAACVPELCPSSINHLQVKVQRFMVEQVSRSAEQCSGNFLILLTSARTTLTFTDEATLDIVDKNIN